MTHDPRPREDDVDNYMRELEALGFSDRVARSRDEAMVWQWQDEIRDQPTHEQLLKLLARVREDERTAALRDAVEAVKLSCSADIELVERIEVIAAIEALGGER